MSFAATKYRLGPFVLASEVPLPELTPLQADDAVEVAIRYGEVPERIEGVVMHETRWFASRNEYLLRVPEVANFLVRGGCEVTVEPATGAQPMDIRAYLLSPIFSTLLHQAGMSSLHASSVRVGEGVVAFLGNSGAGKSTLAAYLERRGYPVISDDICLLDTRVGAAEELRVVPVAPAIKLWRNAVEQLGEVPEDLVQVFSRDDKYRMKVQEVEERLPLREVLFLEWAEAGEPDPASFRELSGVEAIGRLMEFTHYEYLMKAMGRSRESFAMAGRVLAQAKARVFRRQRDFGQMERVLDALAEHWAG